MKYYKLLDEKGTGSYSKFKWDVTGKWMSVEGKLESCKNGFHVLRKEDIVYWLSCGFNLYEVKVKGDKLLSYDKVCVRSVRVVRKIDKYNKDNLLNTVIHPTVKRAKQYAAASDDATAAAAYAIHAADAAIHAASAAYAATYTSHATYAAAVADAGAAAAADAAVAAGYTNYTDERKKQTKDLEKLLK